MASTPRRQSKGKVHPVDLGAPEEVFGPIWKDVSRLSKYAASRSPLTHDLRESAVPSPPVELDGLSGPGCCIEFSADGTRMAVGAEGDRAVHKGSTLNIWSLLDAVPQGDPVTRFVKGRLDALVFSPDGRLLASGPGASMSSSREFGIVIWSEVQPGQFAADGSIIGMSWEMLWEFDVDLACQSSHPICSLMFWESARFLTVGVWQCNPKAVKKEAADFKCGRIELWDVEAQALYRSAVHGCPAVKEFLNPPRTLESFAYSPDYTQMVVGTTARGSSNVVGYVTILRTDPDNWHISAEVCLLSCNFGVSANPISGVAWSADGHWCAAGCFDEVKVWTAPKSFEECRPQASPAWCLKMDGVRHIAFSPDGHSLAAGAHFGVIVLWDVEMGAVAKQWYCHPGIKAVAFAPKAAMIAAVAADFQKVMLFRLDGSTYERECLPLLPAVQVQSQGSSSRSVLSADGAFLAVAMWTNESPWQGVLTVFNLSNARESSNDIVLLWDGGVKGLDVSSCQAAADAGHRGRRGGPKAAAALAHAKHAQRSQRQLVGLLTNERLHIWNLQTNAEMQGLPTFRNASHVVLSPDSRIAIVVGREEETCQSFAIADRSKNVIQRSRGCSVKISVVFIEALREEAQRPGPRVGAGRDLDRFRLDGGESRTEAVPKEAVPIQDKPLNIKGDVLAIAFVDDGPAGPADQLDDVRYYVVIAVRSHIALLSVRHSQIPHRTSLSDPTLQTWDIELQIAFLVQRSSIEPPVPITTVAAQRHNTAVSTWLIAGYGAEQMCLWKVDDNGEVSRIMALNVALMDEVEAVPTVANMSRTRRREEHVRGKAAAQEVAAQNARPRLRFGPLANSLTLATGQRLIVWEELQPRLVWSITHDIRFAGQVWDCNYDQRQEAAVVGESKPRGVVVCDSAQCKPGAAYWTEAPMFLVYDLFEYSLSFHLPDICLLVQRFGPNAVEGRITACPSLLTQRMYPQELGWTLYHWAAFEGNIDVVIALCKEFKAHSETGSPFALDLYKQNALDYALRGRHFRIIDEFLQAAVQEPKMLSNLLPESHTALTKTIVKLLRHPVPMLAAFLDCACLLEPQVLTGELPQKAADTDTMPIRTTEVHAPQITREDVRTIAPSGDFEQPIHIRILCLRGALDKDLGLVKALCTTPNAQVLATQAAKIYLTHKWLGHGRTGFRIELGCYLFYLALFTIWTFHFRGVKPDEEDYNLEDGIMRFGREFLRKDNHLITIRLFMFALTFSFICLEASQLVREARYAEEVGDDRLVHSCTSSCCRKCLKGTQAYFMDLWNWGDLCRLASVSYCLFWDVGARDEIVAVAALFMWLRLLHYCRGFEQTGALVRSFTEIIKEMKAFMILCIIFWFAFGNCFYILLRADNFLEVPGGDGSPMDALVLCYRLFFMGESDIGAEERTLLFQVLFLISTFISSVVALNMLIAIMGDTYSSVQDDAIIARHRELSNLVYEFEALRRSIHMRQRNYLLAAFRKERPLQDVTMSELSMDQLRNDQRTFEKELRRQDHLILHQLSRRMFNVEQMLQARADQGDQLRRSMHQLRDEIQKIQLQNSRLPVGLGGVELPSTPAEGSPHDPLHVRSGHLSRHASLSDAAGSTPKHAAVRQLD